MRVALITAWDDAYEEIALLATPVMHLYCLKHGYTFLPFRGKFHLDPDRDPSLLSYGDRCKIQLYKDLYPDYDLIVWMDVDTIVTNMEVRLEDVLGDRPFLWTYGPSGPLSGFTLARCIPKVHLALHSVLHWCAEQKSAEAPFGRADQDGMRALSALPPYAEVFGGTNLVSCKEAGHCMPFDLYGWGHYAWLGNWDPGDFLVTIPSLPVAERIELLRSYRLRVHGE